ncbi:gp119 [Bacillus phage G]|uniref:Gp119 n=1 Tax=Bacillus phage G TaxID=2884420 RepID=G3MBI1_9CAUD|nr:gp119 [Bacillus phage G]AEO93381.1 gp119 [Bacillus phage G]
MGIFEEISTFIKMVIKSPMRIVCKRKKDHDWYKRGGGFNIFGTKYPYICKKCGCRSNGTFDDLKKKGFKGKAKIYIKK